MMGERGRSERDFSREITSGNISRARNVYRLSGKVSIDESAAEFSGLDSWEPDVPKPHQLVHRTSFSNISFKGEDKTTDEIGAQMSQIDEDHIQLDFQDFPGALDTDKRSTFNAFAEARQEEQAVQQPPVRRRSSHGSRRGRKLPEIPTTRRWSPAVSVPPMVIGTPTETETDSNSGNGSRLLDEAQVPSTAFSSTSLESKPFLRAQNPFLEDAATPTAENQEEESEEEVDPILMVGAYTEGNSTFYDSEEPDPAVPSIIVRGKKREQTHRALYRFIPRHEDELALNVADPLYIEREAEDMWFEGWNIRTEKYGIFPSAYAYEVGAEQEEIGYSGKVHVDRYSLKFLGSVEVPYHKGNDVLCQAMEKVVKARRMTLHTKPPQQCAVDISDKGVKMVENRDIQRKESAKWGKLFGGSSKKMANNEGQNYFFALKNISFCGYHPKNSRYFGFITKHPAERRFACHVLVSEESTRPVAEALGKAFRRFYAEYMDYTHPTEDIYME